MMGQNLNKWLSWQTDPRDARCSGTGRSWARAKYYNTYRIIR